MPRRKTPKPYHHGDLREALVKSATDCIEEGGTASFTLRECARRAGVSHAAPKNHFATAEDLLAEVAARGFERFHQALDKAAAASLDQSAEARLTAMGRAYVAFAQTNPGVYGLMFRASRALAKSEHFMAASRAAWDQLHGMVMQVTGEGLEETRHKAAHVWALVHGIASLIIDRRYPGDAAKLIAVSTASVPGTIKMLGQG